MLGRKLLQKLIVESALHGASRRSIDHSPETHLWAIKNIIYVPVRTMSFTETSLDPSLD